MWRIGQATSAGESRRSRDLVEQRLETMMVLPVDHGDLDRRAVQRFRGFDAAETRTDDDDLRPFIRHCRPHVSLVMCYCYTRRTCGQLPLIASCQL